MPVNIGQKINYEWFSILNLIFARESESFQVQVLRFVSLSFKQYWAKIKFLTQIIHVKLSKFVFYIPSE